MKTMFLLFVVYSITTLTGNVFAEPKEEVNYCHHPEKGAEWAKILKDYPQDPVIIKLFALRTGLCVMIDMKLISLEQGIDLFEEEKQRLIIERGKEERRSKIPS